MANASSTVERKHLAREAQRAAWSDTLLVRECLDGNEEAWSALIDRYKNLIFSIPIKYGFSTDDATDIFQSVCLDLLSELPKLRDAKALPKWIMQIAAHKCFHRKQLQQRVELSDPHAELLERSTPSVAMEILGQAEEEQSLRQAMSELPPRCRQLVHMLFFDEPARPYQEIAAELGIAVGSIGFIRQRCLERLRKRLLETGFS
jgi:RNA polymerase sigma factor (sigma-70 family)